MRQRLKKIVVGYAGGGEEKLPNRLLSLAQAIKQRNKRNPFVALDEVNRFLDKCNHLPKLPGTDYCADCCQSAQIYLREIQNNPDETEYYNLDNDLHEVIFADGTDDVIFADDSELDEILDENDLVENGIFGEAIKRRLNRYRAGRALKQQLKYEDRAARAKSRLTELTKNPAWLTNATNALVGLASAAQIREHLQKQKRKIGGGKTRSRKNPHGDLFREFTGREPQTTTELPVSHLAPKTLDKLGDLVEIRLTDGRKLQFNPNSRKNKVWLTAANKRKMWIVGTQIAAPNPELADDEIEEIGTIDKVIYHEFKPIVGDTKPEFYIHELGEWSGEKPILAADKHGFPVIYGGNYSIESRGIVD